MKYLIALFALLLSISAFSVDLVEPNDRVSTGLTVREAPNSEADAIGSLQPGEQLPLLSSDTSYYYEVDFQGQSGWVSKGYARVIPEENTVSSELRIAFLDVGQGDSTLISCPNGENILIDAGSLSGVGADAIRDQLLPRLNPNDNRIDTLIITHADADHYNRLEDVLDEVPVDQVFWVGTEQDYANYFWDWFDDNLKPISTHLTDTDLDSPNSPNTQIDCGEAEVYVIAAGVVATESRKNAASIVLMVRYGDFKAVFTGDATHDTEDFIMDRYSADWLDVDLLKMGHHGSLSTSTSEDWADALSPEISVVSAGYQNTHGHPRREVIQRLEPHAITAPEHGFSSATGKRGNYTWHPVDDYEESIYSTTTSGYIQVTSDGNGWEVTTQY